MPLRVALLVAALLVPAAAQAAVPTVRQRQAPEAAIFQQQELNPVRLQGARKLRWRLSIRLPGRFVALQPYSIGNACVQHRLVVAVSSGYPPLVSLTVAGSPASDGWTARRTSGWTWRTRGAAHRALLTIVNESPRPRSYTVEYAGCVDG